MFTTTVYSSWASMIERYDSQENKHGRIIAWTDGE
jgi:hypothetical protein